MSSTPPSGSVGTDATRANATHADGHYTALNRPHELEVHMRGALRNGVTRAEIKEILLHTAVYCGAPAALDSFRIANKVFAEQDAA